MYDLKNSDNTCGKPYDEGNGSSQGKFGKVGCVKSVCSSPMTCFSPPYPTPPLPLKQKSDLPPFIFFVRNYAECFFMVNYELV